jgi:hypothetical protein
VPNGGVRKACIRRNRRERDNCSSGEISVGMYKLKEAMEKFCRDLQASHQRKCDCALASMETWRFFCQRKVMESLLVGTRYKPIQSVN